MIRSITAFLATTALLTATAFAEPPAEPRVVDFEAMEKSIGKRGGTLDMLMAKQKDIRQITIYSNARLVGWNQNFDLAPDILKSAETDDNKTFTLTIREGHKWSDGTPFTTEDFRYWWEDVANNEQLEPSGVPREMLVNGKAPSFEVIDEKTLRYSWEDVNPLFLTALAGARPLYIYMPAHYIDRKSVV